MAGYTLDQLNKLPDPPKGAKGFSLDEVNKFPDISSPTTAPKKGILQKTGDVVNSIFPGKQVGQAIGTLGGLAKEKISGALGGKDNSKFYDTSAPSPLQVAGDIGQGALSVAAPEIGNGATALGRIGANAALGAGLGASGAIAQGKEDIGKETLMGGLFGGGVSAAGEGINTLSKNLPRWLTKSVLPKLDGKDINHAINNAKIGSLESMAKKSSMSMANHESQIQNILSTSQNFAADSDSILKNAVSNFPNSNYTSKDLIDNAHSIAPKVGKLLQKMEAGQANVQELNAIRKELDSATKSVYTSLNRPPESKLLGATLADGIREYVKGTNPATIPIFEEYSKEIGLRKAIQAAAKKGEQKVSFKDIIAGGAGFSHGGLSGALKAVIAERLLTHPTIGIGSAKAIQGVSNAARPIIKTAFQGGKSALIKNATNSN